MSYQTDIYLPESNAARSVQIEPTLAVVISKANTGPRHDSPRIAPIITSHQVGMVDGKPVIAAGTVVSPQSVRKIFSEIGIRQPMTWLDPSVLAVGTDGFIWHSPSRVAWMHWLVNGKPARVRAHWPHLVFSVSLTGGFRIYALADDAPPRPDTPLFRAPLGNVFEDASLCWGDVHRPDVALENRQQFEDAVFLSNFTHANTTVLSSAANCAERDSRQDLFGYWRSLSGRKPKAVPLEHLVATQLTVGDLL